MLLFKDDPYRQHVYITSAGRMASAVYKGANNVTSYFSLHDINEDLNRRNAELQAQIVQMQEQLDLMQEAGYVDTLVLEDDVRHFDFIVAHVIKQLDFAPVQLSHYQQRHSRRHTPRTRRDRPERCGWHCE